MITVTIKNPDEGSSTKNMRAAIDTFISIKYLIIGYILLPSQAIKYFSPS